MAWWFSAGCGGGQKVAATAVCPGGDVVVQTEEEARALAPCTAIAGSLTIGPSMALEGLAGLERIERVGGALVIRGNLVLSGAYLPALREIGGPLELEGNRMMAAASLHHVRAVAGDVRVRDNRALERLDLSALQTVGGAIDLRDNPRLDMVELGALAGAAPVR